MVQFIAVQLGIRMCVNSVNASSVEHPFAFSPVAPWQSVLSVERTEVLKYWEANILGTAKFPDTVSVGRVPSVFSMCVCVEFLALTAFVSALSGRRRCNLSSAIFQRYLGPN